MSKRVSDMLTLIAFILIVGVMFILFLLIPDKSFSEIENRTLTKRPVLSVKNVTSGKYMTAFESYLTDQFPFRDAWTELKARSEYIMGKKEYHDVYLCEDGVLITRYDEPDKELVSVNTAAVNALAENTDAEVWLAIVPSASCLYEDRLPNNAPNYNQKQLIDFIYSESRVPVIDILSALEEHKDEYIFYRTDHHWTTDGAWYGYAATMKAMGIEPVPLTDYEAEEVTNSFYGTVYSSSGVHWIASDTIKVYVKADDVTVTNYSNGKPQPGGLYDREFLAHKDKYSMFYGGNTPLLVINTGAAGDKKLLILRDSFMDCESPFFFEHFSEIHIMDLRYYKLSVKEYISDNGIDTVLVSYNAANFANDSSIRLMAS